MSIQPGETVAPSAAAMTLGRLDNLTITVYVPENLYGELSLGQSASVTVDSFPGEIFTATVSHIADQAEFTPRNVQTARRPLEHRVCHQAPGAGSGWKTQTRNARGCGFQ